ncbi:MAG: RNA polymerase sporulation sigma factor SigK [Clostridia bacterium]|nr:RNA polymerase sporulation sigma factor SigK [Clostridia bacterium]
MFLDFLRFALSRFAFLYLRVMNKSAFPPPLKREEEEALLLRLKEGDRAARDQLIERNLRLVAHIIKKFDTAPDVQEDLISVGTIGLIKAIDSYDVSQGARFATYAGKCVQNEILMYFRSQKKYACETSLGESLEVDKDGNALTILDVLKVDDDVVEVIWRRDCVKAALEAVDTVLDPRERSIIRARYGLDGGAGVTQSVLARRFHISRSYVSRLEKGALQKIRAYMTEREKGV